MPRYISNWFHFHVHHWNIDILEYYIHTTLFQVGKAMTNLFIPIYLLKDLNYSIWQVVFFHFVWQAMFIPGVLLAGSFIKNIGLKRSIAFHLPFYAVFFWALTHMTGDFWQDMLWIAPFAAVQALTRATANVSNDIFMANNILKKNSGETLAWLKILMTVGTLAAPLIGGAVSYIVGFGALFYVGITMMLLSGIPLLFVCKSHFDIDYEVASLVQMFKNETGPNYLSAEFGNIFTDTIMWIMWPIFLFFVLENTADIGLLVTAAGVASIAVSYFIGQKIQKGEPKKMIKWGVRSAGFLFFARPLLLNPLFIGFIDAIYQVLDPVFRIPYDQTAYKLIMKNKNLAERANIKQLAAEIYYTITVALLLILTLIFSEFSQIFFVVIFLVSALVMLLMERMAYVRLGDENA